MDEYGLVVRKVEQYEYVSVIEKVADDYEGCKYYKCSDVEHALSRLFDKSSDIHRGLEELLS